MVDDVVIDDLAAEISHAKRCLSEAFTYLKATVTPRCEIDAELFLRELASPNMIGTRSRFDAQATLHFAVVIKSDLERGFPGNDVGSGDFQQPFKRRCDSQGVGNELVVIAAIDTCLRS